VVDDNADAAEGLALLLRQGGHTVRTAYTGPAALDTARELAPQVAILDIGLPGLDGYEVAHRLRQSAPPSSLRLLVALTGSSGEHGRQRALSAGFDQHLVKPIEPDTLLALLAALK
jgi:CheY-like chemotaxis protein